MWFVRDGVDDIFDSLFSCLLEILTFFLVYHHGNM